MSDKYILQGKEPVPADLMTWARWYETADRAVAKSDVGPFQVSTVFLGLDHSFGSGPPMLFETMVFKGSAADEWCERCSTWEQAEEMHTRGCAWAKEQLS
jgi:hypothetical protein